MSRSRARSASWPGQLARQILVAWARATAVIVGQLVVVALFLLLFGQTVSGSIPVGVAWLPLFGFAGLLLIAARGQYHRTGGENPAWIGYMLIAVAPFTAFGGTCTPDGAFPAGARLIQSGVRIGVELGNGTCHTYLNGALLVLGYALLAVGLLLDDRGLGRFGERLLG